LVAAERLFGAHPTRLGYWLQHKLLARWARAGDEDVDETASGLLPAGFVGGVKDVNEGTDEVIGIGILAEITAGDGALGMCGECAAADSESDSRNERYRNTTARLNPSLGSEQYQAMNLSMAFL
jgi:hypothetical protein